MQGGSGLRGQQRWVALFIPHISEFLRELLGMRLLAWLALAPRCCCLAAAQEKRCSEKAGTQEVLTFLYLNEVNLKFKEESSIMATRTRPVPHPPICIKIESGGTGSVDWNLKTMKRASHLFPFSLDDFRSVRSPC